MTPMGPFFLSDLLGLDTVLHVAEHLHESYGDRFYVSPEMKELVAAGQLRAEDRQGLLRAREERELKWNRQPHSRPARSSSASR